MIWGPKKKDTILTFLLSAAVAVAVLAHYPGSNLDWLTTLAWGLLAVTALSLSYSSARIQGYLALFVGCVAALFCLSSFGAVVFNLAPLSGLFSAVMKTLLVYAVGYLLPFNRLDEDGLSKSLTVYVAAVALLAIGVRAALFTNLTVWFSQDVYVYGEKNSTGQILAVAAILLFFFFRPRNRALNIARFVLAGLLAVFLLIVQSRSAAIALAVAAASGLVFSKNRRPLFLPLIGLFALLLQVPAINAFFDRAFFVSRYAGSSLDTFSSGRITLWNEALGVIRDHLLLGTGGYYVDNFYLNVIANVGLLGAGLVFVIWLVRIVKNFNANAEHGGVSHRLVRTLQLLTVFYLVESVFEGMPPFGPGTASFVFWLLSGFYDGASYSALQCSLMGAPERRH